MLFHLKKSEVKLSCVWISYFIQLTFYNISFLKFQSCVSNGNEENFDFLNYHLFKVGT